MNTKSLANKDLASVLVVDDQNASRTILSELLQNITPKLSIIQKSHPQEALDWAVHHTVDLVLVDYMMPDMNGIHFTKVLRTIPAYAYLPIVMVTIMDDADIKQRALEAGVTDFLSKPINLQECVARCQNLLSLQHQQVYLLQQSMELEQQLSKAKQTIDTIEHETIQLLLHLLYHDPADLQRVNRVAHFAQLLGEVSGLLPQEQLDLAQASVLFELESIQTATNTLPTCAQLLSQSHSPLFKMAAAIAKHCRDSYAQTEQEQGRYGVNIPFMARIVTIAAQFDQLVFPKDSTDSASVANALTRLASDAGVDFDPSLVKQLIAIRPRLEKVYEDYVAKYHAQVMMLKN